MPEEALTFLNSERVGVFAVQMTDGTTHAATVHFAYAPALSKFIFLTSPDSKKVEPLNVGETAASFVVGADEEAMKTLQANGTAVLEDADEIRNIYFAKFDGKKEKHPNDVFFTFTPTWWRYTDWTLPQGKTTFTSDKA